MSSEITRENVQAFLDCNAANLKEAALEDQARQLRLTINGNHASRTMTEAQKRIQAVELEKQRRAAKKEARAKAQALVDAATLAVRRYIIACGGVILATALTPFPWYGAMALIPGLAAFTMAYIYRLYVPLEEVKA